jgi:hypothetical protein
MHNRSLACSIAIALEVILALKGGATLARDRTPRETPANSSIPAYPLKASANNRYMVDQNNLQFMIVGDSPHSLIGRMSKSDAEFYMANRVQYGINTYGLNSYVTTRPRVMPMGRRLMASRRLLLPVISQLQTPHTSSEPMRSSISPQHTASRSCWMPPRRMAGWPL